MALVPRPEAVDDGVDEREVGLVHQLQRLDGLPQGVGGSPSEEALGRSAPGADGPVLVGLDDGNRERGERIGRGRILGKSARHRTKRDDEARLRRKPAQNSSRDAACG